ncbi:retinol dehydrogenase 14 [Nannizzia gypsea CBS 118893]|uniref:Retinol dehydrogenase 14 n=1 Tax=Arthroderma gypseum (strain ATCC MYA-4604 / CBS 118893) TaxID=535722 RepID=E4V0X3_ARTGP|nr:retinol dehydrogenase 14 [Nannizzia gypsea CBS 118893]EFR03688.1 retinol dehydrogenase 14 [Nannizzia gypsea CBS 118893]
MNLCEKSVSFKPERDIPPLDGKVILVTGGNIGLGKQCILEYARHGPAQIWMAARSSEKARAAVKEIQQQLPPSNQTSITVLEMDLSSLASVTKAANTFIAQCDRLDILMLNAGVMAVPPGLTTDGYELQFGTNYLGHALLAKLLLPILHKTASQQAADSQVRIIMVSSHGHMYAPKPEGIRFNTLRTEAADLGPYGRYGQSKLAMILWVKHMAKLYPQFTLASIHPGVVRTNLMNNATGSPLIVRALGKVANKIVAPVNQGVKTQLWASVAKDVKSGWYYEPVGIGGTETEFAKDEELAKKLWDWTHSELEYLL